MERKAVSGIMLTLLLGSMFALAFDLQPAEAQDGTLFKITIIAPGNANMLRRQWGQMFADSLKQLGVDARVVFLGWAEVYDRVFTPSYENVGKTYDEGGFDIQLVGWTPGLIPEPRQNYYGGDPGFFAPDGQNYYLWNNTESNFLLNAFITSTNVTERNQILQEWQLHFYNELPCSQIYYGTNPAVVTPELGGPALTTSPGGTGWLYFNKQPNPEMITGKTSVVYASTGEIQSLIPPLSNSWYDTIITAPIFNGLAQVATDLSNVSVPALLTEWTPSENDFKWTFKCRTGVKWHDGEDFTADDVVFSLWSLMSPDTGSQFVGYYRSVYGNNVKLTYENGTSTTLGDGARVGNITAVDSTTVVAWLPELALGKPYGYFDPYLLTFTNNIIPKHIFEKIPPAQWTNSPFNTGVGTIIVPGTPGTVAPETYNGPVGTGPYKWVSYDPVAQFVHLQKFNDYWNRTALEAEGLFGVADYYVRFIVDTPAALAALKNDEVDILDPNYQMQVDIPAINPAWGKVLLNEGTGRQEAGYNNLHPIFGTGADTPLGKSDPSRAAEAAKYVRIAFDYSIPRQMIIDNLLVGFGTQGATPILPTQPYYNSSITPRSFNLSEARSYLQKAGYTVSNWGTHKTMPKAQESDGTVYIRPDGSIEPPTAPIQRDGDIYTLTGGITSETDGIVVERDSIVVDGAGYTVSAWRTGVDLSDRSNVTIKNMEIWASQYCIYLSGSLGNTISANNVTGLYAGVALCDTSKGNSISGNNITNTCFAIELYRESDYNRISGNNLKDNSFGIWLYGSSNNNISVNNITANRYHGIVLKYHSDYNSVSENSVAASSYFGVEIYWSSDYNVISGNEIANNGCGINAVDSSNNLVCHNNFLNNTRQVELSYSIDIWDDGYPSGGNFWSDYVGADVYRGPDQAQLGIDAIGDDPYVIDQNNQDRYPLMGSFGTTTEEGDDVAVFPEKEAALVFKKVTKKGHTRAKKFGGSPPPPPGRALVGPYYDIKTTAYYSGMIMIRIIYDDSGLTPEQEGSLQLTHWLLFGDVTGETPNPYEFVSDGKVDIKDIAIIAKYFGQDVPPAPPECDISSSVVGMPDGKIDIKDIALAAKNFGKLALATNITTYLDTESNLIIGETDHLSIMGVTIEL